MKKKIKKIILYYVIGIALLVGVIVLAVVWQGGNKNETSLPYLAGALKAIETSFDFGQISMAAGKVSHSFKVKNSSSQPVKIGKLYTSCMCTEASFVKGNLRKGPFGMPGHGFIPKLNETIAPGEEITLEVIFDPAAHGPAGLGRVERRIYLEQEGGQPLELSIKALVAP
jgi:hypothetical protein